MQARKSKKTLTNFILFKPFLSKNAKSNKNPLAKPAKNITSITIGWFKVGYSIKSLLKNSFKKWLFYALRR